MNKKQNHISARQAAEKAVIRDEQNRRIRDAATNPVPEVLKELHTTLCGLDMEEVSASRARRWVTARCMPKPNSALSSNREFSQAGPWPFLLTV